MPTRQKFITKAKLYAIVSDKAKSLGYHVNSQNYKIDSLKLAQQVCINLEIVYIDFKETKICGMLFKADKSTSIGLNKKRSSFGKNFDCMHELIHYWFHDNNCFYCNENDTSHFEWQANEGAAQFLMPYQSFVPAYSNAYDRFFSALPPDIAYEKLLQFLAHSYLVGEKAVEYRLNGLEFEILQYLKGTPIENLEICSKRKQAYAKSVLNYG